jgi:hypothetical protein
MRRKRERLSSLFVAATTVACATQSVGGETHFLCRSDADCRPSAPTCVKNESGSDCRPEIASTDPDGAATDFTPGRLPDGGYRALNRACGGKVPVWTAACATCIDSDTAVCDACLGDVACSAFDACLEACGYFTEVAAASSDVPNPGCLLRCRDTTQGGVDNASAFPGWMNAAIGGQGCAYRDDACRAGSRWKCVGRYHWPAPLRAAVHVTLAVPGLTSARYCDGTALGCPEADASSAAVGGELDIPAESRSSFGTTGTFPHFEFTAATSSHPVLFYAGHPIIGDEALAPIGPFEFERGTALLADIGVTVDPAKAYVVVSPVSDCTGVFAPGVRVTVDGADGYYTTSPFLGPWGYTTLTGTVAGPNGVGFPNLDGDRIVTVQAEYAGKEVARERVEIRNGAVTWLQLYPTPAFL